jgi:hypothetical protein
MKLTDRLLVKLISSGLAILLCGTQEVALAAPQQTTSTEQQQTQAPVTENTPAQPPSSTSTPSENNAQAEPTQSQTEQLPNSPGSTRSSSDMGQKQNTQRPLGTAAAEIGNASGTAASKPAGVAIAPAKQHQSRSFLIKMGALVGVGVALGTVMALSSASPSKPPNSQ